MVEKPVTASPMSDLEASPTRPKTNDPNCQSYPARNAYAISPSEPRQPAAGVAPLETPLQKPGEKAFAGAEVLTVSSNWPSRSVSNTSVSPELLEGSA